MRLLNSFQNLKLGTKLNAILLMVLASILLIVLVVVVVNIENVIVEVGRQRLEQETHVIGSHLTELEQQVIDAARSMAKSTALIDAAAQGNLARLRSVAIVEASSFGLSDFDIVNAAGERLLRVSSEDVNLAL